MDLASLQLKEWKESFSLRLKYTVYKRWYANITFCFYPQSYQQKPWDPGFTYGCGYFDWHPGTITIQYSNYFGDRYTWRDGFLDTGTFRDGSIATSWSWPL
nr:hypothetical protein [Desulfobacterales bacterium]